MLFKAMRMASKETVIKIDGSPKDEAKAEINILCFNLTPYSQLTQFLCCTAFVFVFYLVFGYFLELIFTPPEAKPISLFITLVQFSFTVGLSYSESLIREPIKRRMVNPTVSNEEEVLYLFGCDLTPYSQLTQMLWCSGFILLFGVLHAYILEIIIFVPLSRPAIGLALTLGQYFFFAGLSYLESLIGEPIKRRVPLSTYAMLALLTLGTMTFSNLALSFLNYPTQLIFKSCKLLPVMVGSIIILNKKYWFLDYVAAVVMCVGLTMFTLADSNVSPNFDSVGVLIISLALLCDAIIGNVQEKAMKQHQASNNEVVFYSYSIGFVYLLIINYSTGMLWAGFDYLFENLPRFLLNVFLLSLTGYCGLQAVLTLVRISGATVAVTVTTMRKALSIVISFLMFNKAFVFQYAWSGMLVLLAIYLNHYSKKNPGYVPKLVLLCWHYLISLYKSEYRYLKVKTKTFTDTV